MAGTDEEYATGGQADMKAGRFFTETENEHRMAVVVIGEDLYRALFGQEDAIGKRITVDGRELEVVGVMNRPATSVPGQDDNRVLMPFFTMHKIFPSAQEMLLMAQAKQGQLPAAIDEIRVVLRQERHVKLADPDNFFISTPEQIVDQFRQVTAVIALVMVVLSSICLLVGGIGVMNIMLDFRHRADKGDWGTKSHWRAAFGYYYSVSDRSRGPDGIRRTMRNVNRMAHLCCQSFRISEPAYVRAVMGGGVGDCGVTRDRIVFRNLACQ